jgi:hypothetical protein
MRRGIVAFVLGVLLLSLLPAAALAAPVQDQANTSTGSSYAGGTMAQTFTAGMTGDLTSVRLYLSSGNAESQTVSIEGVDGSSNPDGNVLASASASIADTGVGNPAWVDFTFGTPASVTSGTQYAIVMTTVNVQWYGTAENYAGGGAAASAGGWIGYGPTLADFSFATFVDAATTPTPSPTATPTSQIRGATPGSQATPPPTSTAPAGGSDDGGLVIVFAAAFALVAAFSLRRPSLQR